MNKGLLVGDNIALAMENAANTARANATLDRQKGYHCGDRAIQAAALAELQQLNPENALLTPVVQQRIYDLAEAEFHRCGWDKGASFTVSPIDVRTQLLAEFEEKREKTRAQATKDEVKTRTRGFFKRREVHTWRDQEFQNHQEAIDAKRAELARIARAALGDKL